MPKRRHRHCGRAESRDLQKGEAGFTLPEMTIVIAIMGIVLAIASSSWFATIEGRRVDSATTQLVSDLRLAHSKATNRLTEQYIVYVPNSTVPCSGSNADYCLVSPDDDGSYRYIPRELPDHTKISGTTLADDTASSIGGLLGMTPRTLKLKADGSVEAMGGLISGATTPSITVAGGGASNHTLKISATTSRIKID